MQNQNYCGNCRHHRYIDGEWICTNEESDTDGLETEYSDSCDDWEGK